MPAPTPPKGLGSGAASFLKSNAKFAYGGGIGLAFLGADIKNIFDADNKLKALLKTAKDFILIRVVFIGLFKGVSDVVKGLVRDTGSLDAALKRLNQVQQYARQFQSFTGSLSAAKKQIAELHQLSTRGVFRFEDLVEANKSLQVFTRGAYTSIQATKQVGEVALATGNSIQDTARAVGSFYDQLRSGQPVGQAAEQLRQMGIISGSTADELTNMSETGADVTTTFGALTAALEKTGKGAADYKNELQGVTEAHAKAAEELKVAFGAPWTDSDIQTTKNMTDGMKSITPAVGKLSQAFALVYNSSSTFISTLFKIVAGSKIAQKAIVIFGQAIITLTVAAGVFGSVALIPLTVLLLKFAEATNFAAYNALVRLGVGMVAATRAALLLEVAMAGLTIGTGVLLAIGFITAMIAATNKAREEAKQAGQEFQNWDRALRDSTTSILEQAAAVTTLASKYEALGKTIQKISENQKELNQIHGEGKNLDKELARAKEVEARNEKIGVGGSWNLGTLTRRFRTQPLERKKALQEAKEAELQRQQDILKQSREEQAARQPLHENLVKQEAERRYFFEQQSKSAAQKDEEARRGAKIAAQAEDDKSKVVAKRMQLEKELEDTQAKTQIKPEKMVEHQQKILGLQDSITKAKQEEQQVGLSAPEYSATYKEAKAEQLRTAKRAIELEGLLKDKKYATTEAAQDERRSDEARLKSLKAIAGAEALKAYSPTALAEAEKQAAVATKREAEPPSPGELQQQKLEAFKIQNEVEGQRARARGDVRTARASEDLSRFTSHFDQLLSAGFGKPEAIKTALEQTGGDIAEEISQTKPPVSSLTAIGGGGGLPQVDAQLDIARRQEQLQQKMVEYLAILSGAEQPDQQTQPVYQ
jgi:hypothetical protein